MRLRAQWLATRRPLSSRCVLLNRPVAARAQQFSRTSARPFYKSTTDDTRGSDPKIGNESIFTPLDTFPRRHIGPNSESSEAMLKALDPPAKSLDDFVRSVLPADILSSKDLKVEGPKLESGSMATSEGGYSESQLLARLREIASENKVYKSYIGCGYSGTRTPETIKRNILENPAWYTSYTPYQPEISQGRLESLLNFQTMVTDLTGLAYSNASVLDEATAAAEAMTLSINSLPAARLKRANKVYLVSHLCHPQTIAVLESRAQGFGVTIEVADVLKNNWSPALQIRTILLSIQALLGAPNPEDPLNEAVAKQWKVRKLAHTIAIVGI